MLDKNDIIEMTPLKDQAQDPADKKKSNDLIPGKAWLGYVFQVCHVIFFCTN